MDQNFLRRLWEAKAKSPQRHSSLPPELEARAKAVWQRVKPWWASTFEPFEFQLTKDEHPETEIAIWERVADALESYLASHRTADRGWAQDILCMISLGIWPTKEMPSKRRRMFKELRRVYLNCGGKITQLEIARDVPQVERAGWSSLQDSPATPIEQVADVDVMRADVVIARDRETGRCYQLYPESLPSPADYLGEPNRKLLILAVEFDQENEHHKELADHIITVAKGEAR